MTGTRTASTTLGQEGKQARLHAHVDAGKSAAVTACLGALGNDSVNSAPLEHLGLGDRRRAGDHKDACALDRVANFLAGKAEPETHHLRLCVQQH